MLRGRSADPRVFPGRTENSLVHQWRGQLVRGEQAISQRSPKLIKDIQLMAHHGQSEALQRAVHWKSWILTTCSAHRHNFLHSHPHQSTGPNPHQNNISPQQHNSIHRAAWSPAFGIFFRCLCKIEFHNRTSEGEILPSVTFWQFWVWWMGFSIDLQLQPSLLWIDSHVWQFTFGFVLGFLF